jgi:hypothetical protein
MMRYRLITKTQPAIDKYLLESGPYKGKIVYLKRKDRINDMRFVIEVSTNEMFLVKNSEISDEPVNPTKLKLKIKR